MFERVVSDPAMLEGEACGAQYAHYGAKYSRNDHWGIQY